MSAIVGLWRRDGLPLSPDSLQPALNALQAYGSDGTHAYNDGPLAFGHVMQHITPESHHEQQPRHDAAHNLTITADARIDNRDDMCALLHIDPPQRKTITDSALILQAYAKWGVHCVQHLIGDYAFAVWDAAEQRLFLARDHIGARPLYIYQDAACVAFATDIRALLHLPGVPHDIDESEVAFFMLYTNRDHPRRTMYQHINKLEHGHWLLATPDTIHTARYWHPADVPRIRYKHLSDYAAALRELLHQAVACRVRTPHPVAAHLSSGIDSTVVAILAGRIRREQGRDVIWYSWAPPISDEYPIDEMYDERLDIAAVEAQENRRVHYAPMFEDDIWQMLQVDISVQRPVMIQHEYPVYRQAQPQGVRVLLSGWGGDEFISFKGRGYANQLFWRGRWWRLLRYLQVVGEKRISWRQAGHYVVEQVVKPSAYHIMPEAIRRRRLTPNRDNALINPDFAAHILSQMRPPVLPFYLDTSVRRVQRYFYERAFLQERIEAWAVSGAAAGITYAYPLLDRRVMAFALGVPPDVFVDINYKVPRQLLYRATADLLPPVFANTYLKSDQVWQKQWQSRPIVTHYARQMLAKRQADPDTWQQPIPWTDVDAYWQAIAQIATGQQRTIAGNMFTTTQIVHLWHHQQALRTEIASNAVKLTL